MIGKPEKSDNNEIRHLFYCHPKITIHSTAVGFSKGILLHSRKNHVKPTRELITMTDNHPEPCQISVWLNPEAIYQSLVFFIIK